MFRLDTFGGLRLTCDQRERSLRRRQLALLARLAVAADRGVSRDELLAMFWPESDGDGARHSLDQLLYEARRTIGASLTSGTTTLRLDPDVIASDVADWAAALADQDLERVVAVYQGPFLQGFYLQGAQDFERWVESKRTEFVTQHRRALEALAAQASRGGRVTDAVDWWRRLAAEDRFGSRTALGLMRAMVDAGDRAGALDFARVHEQIVLAELDSPPDPVVTMYAESLRTSPSRAAATPNAERITAVPASTVAASAPDASTPALGPVSTQPGERRRSRVPFRAGAAALVLVPMLALMLVAIRYRDMAPGHQHGLPNARPGSAQDAAASARRPAARGTKNLAAYDLYVHGNDRLHQRSDSGFMRAIAELEQSVALDPNYAEAYAALARAYGTASTFTFSLSPTDRDNMHARAVAAASRAIALDDSLADAHAELGYLLGLGHDPLASISELERSLALDSTVSDVYEELAKAYELADRPDDAVVAAERAVSTDSMSAAAAAELGDALYYARRYDDALSQLMKVVALRPPLRRTAFYLDEVYLVKHRWKEAIDVMRPDTSDRNSRGLIGYALARSGRERDARRLLQRMLATKSTSAAAVAEVYIGLRRYDSAFVWLDRSFDDHSLHPMIMGPLFDDVHARPEFRRVRKRLGLPPG